jgi:hypothetical protein
LRVTLVLIGSNQALMIPGLQQLTGKSACACASRANRDRKQLPIDEDIFSAAIRAAHATVLGVVNGKIYSGVRIPQARAGQWTMQGQIVLPHFITAVHIGRRVIFLMLRTLRIGHDPLL